MAVERALRLGLRRAVLVALILARTGRVGLPLERAVVAAASRQVGWEVAMTAKMARSEQGVTEAQRQIKMVRAAVRGTTA
ncbi:hypothetical protein DJ78_01970, partial [Halorubrum ezzemoulense]